MDASIHGRVRSGVTLVVVAAVAILFLLPATAGAAVGDIVGQSCISKAGTDEYGTANPRLRSTAE